MAVKVAINGFGRIGRLVFRALVEQGLLGTTLDVVAVGDIVPADNLAYLLKYDSTQGRFAGTVTSKKSSPDKADDDVLVVNGKDILVVSAKSPAELPWAKLGVSLVIESTGLFTEAEKAKGHITAGAKKVIISAPAKGEDITVVLGVNDDKLDLSKHSIISNASCTTNCLAPVVKVVHEAIGIRHGQITTIHDPTNTNVVVDAPHKDLRRARSAMLSLAPTTTGSATAIALIYPELKGKLNGHAVRAPVLNASLTDCVFEMARETRAEEVNALFAQAAHGPLAGILGYETRPLVSADYARDTRSSVVDAPSTMVTDGTLLKVYAWYDNEMGYACRMVDLACHMAEVGI
jgi:glyceraldehyde 3-phosphate dehydrogenase